MLAGNQYAIQGGKCRRKRRGCGVRVVPAYSRLVWGQSAPRARQHFEAEFHIFRIADALPRAKSVCRMLVLPEW
jgi:hypothetical protein